MQVWPLLEIRAALSDADKNLQDVLDYVSALQGETEGHLPPEAPTLLANIVALRELLTAVIPPALAQAITDEQSLYDEEEARWEPSNY
jgi:hypothetical protein